MKRYIVLGLVADVMAWRRERRLSPRDVIAVSTTCGDLALRGLGRRGVEYEVVRLPSWGRASDRVRDAVEQNLTIMRLTGCALIG